MINIPIENILMKLKESGLSEDDIEKKIKQKMDQLSGLISREGAAHIIANELGIKVVEKTSGRVKIKDVFTGMRNVEAVGKVTNVFDVREFQRSDGNSSKVGSFIIGDETGTIRITCWGNQADNVLKIKQNDIVKIVSAYVKENQGRKELHLNDNSKIIINPTGEVIGDISFESREFDRKKISDLNDNMMNIEIMGTVVGVDALRFFEVCPQCNKRARNKRDEYECEKHGVVQPDYSYVMNIILDDGTGNLRVVCFREMVEKCLGLDKKELLILKDTPDLTPKKDSLLGKILKVKGRVKRNQMFDRLEFSCQDVDLNPDPYEEMDGLDKDLEVAKEKSEVTNVDEI
jgi:ssDNA-binding replication factor A large subunit